MKIVSFCHDATQRVDDDCQTVNNVICEKNDSTEFGFVANLGCLPVSVLLALWKMKCRIAT